MLFRSGELDQLISDSNLLGLPQLISTERPDKAAKYLLKGRAVIIVNGTPAGVITPAIFSDFLTSPEDTNLKTTFANFSRIVRFIAAATTLFLPALYVAITNFHQEILPTGLLYSILSSRENVPFPIIFEIVFMEFSFELIREAALRVPSAVATTIRYCWCFSYGRSSSKCRLN